MTTTATATRTKTSTVISKPAKAGKAPKNSKQLEITDAAPASTVGKTKQAKPPVRTFRDLGTWRAAYDLAVAVCRQVEAFPASERALTNQITDTVVSICSSIAEAFSHSNIIEKNRYYEATQAQLTKLANQLLLAHGLGYINTAQHEELARRGSTTHWILSKLQRINQEWAESRA